MIKKGYNDKLTFFTKTQEEKKLSNILPKASIIISSPTLVKTDVIISEHAATFLPILVLNLSEVRPKH